MEKLKEALIQFTHSNPSLFPQDSENSCSLLIEQCFPKFFSDFQTPNHPPYAAMIYKAIWELKKKRGSSEESISKYIQKEYADLPWAHSTLLKHHLEKLCDGKEIIMTDKQRYLLAGAESESELGKKSRATTKKRKKETGRLGTKGGKKSSRPYKKSKKNEKSGSGIQKASDKEQIGLRKRKKKQMLKSKSKSSKHAKKNAINDDTKLLLLDEANLKENEVTDDESQNGLRKRKRKQGLKSKKKSSKRTKKHAINEDTRTKLQLLDEANLKQNDVNGDKSHEQKQMLEVKMGDIQVQEQNEAGQEQNHENSGCINLEQTQRKKNTAVLQPEESPESNPTFHGNGKRVWTRSQLKTVLKKDALAASSESTDSLSYANMPRKTADNVHILSNEKQNAMEIIKVQSAVDSEQQISRSPSLEKPLIELLNPMPLKSIPWFPDDEPTASPSSTEVLDPISSHQKPMYKRRGRRPKLVEPEKSEVNSQQSAKQLIPRFPDDEPTPAPSSSTQVQDPIISQLAQQPEKLLLDDKPKYKRRGRPPKPKSEVKSQQAAKKGKVGKKKGQLKCMGNGRHKMARRSSRNPS